MTALTFATADLNGDRNVDLVLPGEAQLDGPSGIGIYLGNGDGTFQAHGEAGAPGRAQRGRAGGGGGLERTAFRTFLGKGDGMFATPFYIGAGPNPGGILAENLHRQPASAGRPDWWRRTFRAGSWC